MNKEFSIFKRLCKCVWLSESKNWKLRCAEFSALFSFLMRNLILGTNQPYFLVLWTIIGVTAGYHGWTYISNFRIDSDWFECLGQSVIWTSLPGRRVKVLTPEFHKLPRKSLHHKVSKLLVLGLGAHKQLRHRNYNVFICIFCLLF